MNMRLALILCLLGLILIAFPIKANVSVNASINPQSIPLGDSALVTINVKGASVTQETVLPLDVVLVMDCSGSMNRYGNIISDVYDVTLTTKWQKIGEFTLNKSSKVELMLQTLPGRGYGADVYTSYDYFYAYLKNKDSGVKTSIKEGSAIVRWNLAQGDYEVYVRLVNKKHLTQPNRQFGIELPSKRIELAKQAAKNFVDELKDNDRVALVKFHSKHWNPIVRLVEPLTFDKKDVKAAIDELNVGGGTPLGEGIKKALDHLSTDGRNNAVKAIIVLTDGWWNMGCNPIDQAERAKEMGVRIYTIGWGGVNESELKRIAEITGGRYYYALTGEDLEEIYSELAKKLTNISAKNVTVKFVLDEVRYLDASLEPIVNGKTLIWKIGDLSANETWSVNVRVKPEIESLNGSVNISVNTNDSKLIYEWGEETREIPINELKLNVYNYVKLYAVPNKTKIKVGESVGIDVYVDVPFSCGKLVEIKPETLEIGSHGVITAFIFDNADPNSIVLSYTNNSNVTVNITPSWVVNTPKETIAKFDRDELNPYLDVNDCAVMWVYWNGSKGYDNIRIIYGKLHGNEECNCCDYCVSSTPVVTWESEDIKKGVSLHLNWSFDSNTLHGKFTWIPKDNFVKEGYREAKVKFKAEYLGASDSKTVTMTVYNIGTPDLTMMVSGKGLFIGDIIWIYVLNNCTPPKDQEGIAFRIDAIVKSTDSSIGRYNITANGIEIVDNASVPDPGKYVRIPFVPPSAGIYNMTFCVWNLGASPNCQNVRVGVLVKPVSLGGRR